MWVPTYHTEFSPPFISLRKELNSKEDYLQAIHRRIIIWPLLFLIINGNGHSVGSWPNCHSSQRPPHPTHDDQIEHLTQTVNTLTAQLTSVLSITQNNHFLVSPLQESVQRSPMGEVSSHHLSPMIQPVRFTRGKEPTSLHLLALVAHQTAVDADELEHERVWEEHVEIQEEPQTIVYPVVPGISVEKVKQLIDAFLRGVKWRDMMSNYSQTIKPVREAWERLHTTT